jgi:hypothetical protein
MSSVAEQVLVVIHDTPRIDAPLLGVYEAGEPLAGCLRQLMLQVYGVFPTVLFVGAETFRRMGQPGTLHETPVLVGDVPENHLVAAHKQNET